MYQHEYDDSGLISSYLMLTIVTPIALYSCMSAWRSLTARRCKCMHCTKCMKTSYRIVVLALVLCALIAHLIHNVVTIQLAKSTAGFDPFAILRVEEGASATKVKKAYKALMRRLHTHGSKIADKDNMIVAANKAYKLLRDPSTYQKWISDTSEKKSVIALPLFLITFSSQSIIAYLVILGLLVPTLIYRKYMTMKYRCTTGALYESVQDFYSVVDGLSNDRNILIHQLLTIISKSAEFSGRKWKTEVSDLRKTVEEGMGIPLLHSSQAFLQIMNYLARAGAGSPEDEKYTAETALALIEAFIRVAMAKQRSVLYKTLLTVRKMFVQAVIAPEYFMMQFPGMSVEKIVGTAVTPDADGKGKSAKAAAVGDSGRNERSQMTAMLSEALEGRDLKNALNVLHRMPSLTISRAEAYTLNTDEVSSNFSEEISRCVTKEGNAYKLEKGVPAYLSVQLTRGEGDFMCHAPFLGEGFRHRWTVSLYVGDSLRNEIRVIDDFKGERELTLPLPLDERHEMVTVCCTSNGYFGIDSKQGLLIKRC